MWRGVDWYKHTTDVSENSAAAIITAEKLNVPMTKTAWSFEKSVNKTAAVNTSLSSLSCTVQYYTQPATDTFPPLHFTLHSQFCTYSKTKISAEWYKEEWLRHKKRAQTHHYAAAAGGGGGGGGGGGDDDDYDSLIFFFIYPPKCCNLSEDIQQSCWLSLSLIIKN